MLKKLLEVGRYPEFIRLVWWRFVTPYLLRRKGVEIGVGVRFLGTPIVSLAPDSRIVIGDRVSLCSLSEYTALGVNHPVILRTLRPGAVIEIGADTGISGASICAANKVSIGKQCLFGANVTIADTDFHAINPSNRRYNKNTNEIKAAPIVIGDNVFVGASSIILKGTAIGENSVVGAGAVVTQNVPENAIAVGSPAHVTKSLR